MYRLRNSVDNWVTIALRAAGSSGADGTDDAPGTEVCAIAGAATLAKSKDTSTAVARQRIELSSATGAWSCATKCRMRYPGARPAGRTTSEHRRRASS